MIRHAVTARMRTVVTAALCAGLLVLVACSSGSSKRAPTPTSTPLSAEAFRAAASTAADLVLLKSSDLPAGWSGSPHTPASMTGFTGECTPLNPEDPITGSALSKSSDDFASQKDDEAGSQADVFTSADAASTSFTSLISVIAKCRDQMVALHKALYTRWGPALLGITDPRAVPDDVQVSLVNLRGPGYGDASAAYRLAFGFTVGDVRVAGESDVVFIRTGAIVTGVTYTAVSGGTPLTDQIAKAIADRMAQANRTLPQ